MQFYTYIFYNENWEAYYVGKGIGQRCRARYGHPKIPPNDRIQVFHFSEEWEAWECEVDLISFWKRESDGGCLKNKAIGGPGCTGYIHSQKARNKMSECRTGDKNARARAHIVTTPAGKEIRLNSIKPYCRKHGLDPSHMCKVAKGKIKHHKGYTVRYIEN
mgnify:CR=1 FL=1|tara:strand:+ start:1776 stop:2258 length:483 start_codon:yes stop_codon:yes gene_type:complete